MRVVFDTNIVVSGMLWTGAPAQAMDKATEAAFFLVSSEILVAELRTTLSRSKFAKRFGEIGKTVDEFLDNYRALVELVEPAVIEPVILEDPKDDAVLACALGGQADYIVSGDGHLLRLNQYQAISIVTVNHFMDMLNKV